MTFAPPGCRAQSKSCEFGREGRIARDGTRGRRELNRGGTDVQERAGTRGVRLIFHPTISTMSALIPRIPGSRD